MSTSTPDTPPPALTPVPRTRSIVDRVLAFFGSFNIAIVLFALIILITFIGTWQQKEYGTFDCVEWYFDPWIVPRHAWLWGWVPLPGMALLLAVLSVNVLAGGIIRIRKSKRTMGVVISHLSVLGFIIAGAVSLWSKTEGHMRVFEGGKNNIVESQQGWTLATRELTTENGAPPDKRIFYVTDNFLDDCTEDRTRTFFRNDWPFEIVVSDYLRNTTLVPAGDPSLKSGAPRSGDYALKELEINQKNNEMNFAGLLVKIKGLDGNVLTSGLLYSAAQSPLVFDAPGGRRFAVDLMREQWQVPFSIFLEDFRAEYYPGIRKAKSYESDIRVTHENGIESKHLIRMNNPLRDAGYVAYQTSFDSDAPPGKERYSVFTVVKNRSDQWPFFSLIFCAGGLAIHFIIKLSSYFKRSSAAAAKTPVTP